MQYRWHGGLRRGNQDLTRSHDGRSDSDGEISKLERGNESQSCDGMTLGRAYSEGEERTRVMVDGN